MNKKCSVRVPVTEDMLKELRRKAQEDDIDVTAITRRFWREWIAGKCHIALHIDDQSQSEAA